MTDLSLKAQDNYQFHTQEKTFSLKRYPYNPSSQLRAWDAADHYLLHEINALLEHTQNLVIVHDSFGALATALAGYNPVCYGDSWMSLQAMELNRQANNIESALRFEADIDQLIKTTPKPTLIIGRVPKSKAQLAFLLNKLCYWADEQCQLYLAGMDKHLSKGQYNLIEHYFGPSSFLPGVKKARIWKAVVDKSKASQLIKPTGIKIPHLKLDLNTLPNVFSHDKLDIGSRFFLDNLDRIPDKKRVADLACGTGVLGLAYLSKHPGASLYFTDESFQAAQCTQLNLETHFPEHNAVVKTDNGLSQAKNQSFDLILCNPPFHQQHIISTEIAENLFNDAYRCLALGGELWLVANRHLNYHIMLKKIFGHFTTIASNSKFVILKTIKE